MFASTRTAATAAGPSIGGIFAAAVFWVVAISVAGLTIAWNMPTYVWALRVSTIVVGVAIAVGLIWREKDRERRSLPPDRDITAFDLWTIAHTFAGLVMGSWGVPGPLVMMYTIGWEIFEWTVPGFGDAEILPNRIVDVLVAWAGWLMLAALVAVIGGPQIPFLLPLQGSLFRP